MYIFKIRLHIGKKEKQSDKLKVIANKLQVYKF